MIKTEHTTHGTLVTDNTGTPLYFEQGFIFIDSGIGGENIMYTLKEPVKISIVFDDESREYILSNDLFHLLSHHSSLPDAIRIIQEQIYILYEEYVIADPVHFHSSAIAFRELLKRFVEVA
ncbi:MAG TPA: hypothetical protein VN372_07100 [Methanospirillum sp.]|nr:hypothetical protein [Methanospirillum sp.]